LLRRIDTIDTKSDAVGVALCISLCIVPPRHNRRGRAPKLMSLVSATVGCDLEQPESSIEDKKRESKKVLRRKHQFSKDNPSESVSKK
jgi:hypothetical protein